MNTDYKKFNREAFIAFWQQKDADERGWRSWAFLAAYILGMLAFIPGVRHVEEHPEWAWVWFVLFFGYLFVAPLLWSKIFHKKQEKTFLKCPSCQRPVAGINRMIIVATGRCGLCGNEILE